MQFWFQKSDKEAGSAYVGAEHKGVSGFVELHIGKHELACAVGAARFAAALRQLTKRTRAAERRQREAARRLKLMRQPHKDPRRSTGMNLNIPLHGHRRRK